MRRLRCRDDVRGPRRRAWAADLDDDGEGGPARPTRSLGVRTAWMAVVPALLLLLVAGGAAAQGPDWTQVTPVRVADGLEVPANIDIAPDGSVWYAEVYTGNVSSFDPATGQHTLHHHVDAVSVGDERGLVGFALDANFGTNGVFYLYYTAPSDDPDGGVNRLVRVEDGQEILLAAVPGAVEHNGGRILVAPDGTLFVGTGDNQLRDPAQDPDSLLGKILHMTPHGDPVEGNAKGLVYSLGHRNVYGLAWDEAEGRLWANENSGWRRDEVNIIQPGGNYGYPECEGHGLNGVDTPCPTDKGYIFPVMTFYEDSTAVPVGAAFWHGDYHWGAMPEGAIHRIRGDGDGGWTDEVVHQQEGPILEVKADPDGRSLYFATWDAIWRIDGPVPGDPAPDKGSGGAGPGGGGDGRATIGAMTAGTILGTLVVLVAALRRPDG